MNNRALLFALLISLAGAEIFSVEKLKSYARIFKLDKLAANETGNELWRGLFKDCRGRVSFSCIQKNAYSYLDEAISERSNVTLFSGLILRRNDLVYESCPKRGEESVDENLVDAETANCEAEEDDSNADDGRKFQDEPESPLEEVTNALRKKTVKFLATRDYEIQLPNFISRGASIRISPKEVDENGALVRIDFGQRGLDNPQARIFKKLRKFIQGRLITALLGLLLLIKLIQVKFMFVIPFLFGIGTAKKLFLKLLLFFIPAFAHIFKLCSSFYSSHATKYHHHHHQIAHHHHHVPVPVPVPTYYNHHHHHHEDDFDGYDYAHPHIQYRKDIEELKEWGIEPYDEPYDDVNRHRPVPGVLPAPMSPVQGQAPVQGQIYPGSYGLPQYAANVRPVASYQDKQSTYAHNLAYAGYLDEQKFRRVGLQPNVPPVSIDPGNVVVTGTLPMAPTNQKNFVGQNNVRVQGQAAQGMRIQSVPGGQRQTKSAEQGSRRTQEEDYYAAIVGRLEAIFAQLRFFDETCRERLVCSMYKSPTQYSPHSNLVSNELARDPHELKRSVETTNSQKFHRYVTAARLGQDGGDCLRTYPCRINTE